MLKRRKIMAALGAVLIALSFTWYFAYSSKGSNDTANVANVSNAIAEKPIYESMQVDSQPNSEILSSQPEVKTEEQTAEANAEKKKPEIIKYTVKPGDTLESIANAYGIKTSGIAESNGITLNSILKIGQELQFPSVTGVLYKIKQGETLWDLATTYNMDVDDIAAVNNMDSIERIQIGQAIIIPGIDKLKPDTNIAVANASDNVKLASRGSILSKGIWPARGSVTSMYGPRWGTNHNGIDIAAPTGTDVYAFMDGIVEFSGWNSGGYGNLVIIDHGNGLQSYYAHNLKVLVEKGQPVSKGQHIAEVGSTGDSTGPHSHFEIRKNGTPVNPYNYLN